MAGKPHKKPIPKGAGAGSGKRTRAQARDHHLRHTYGLSYDDFLGMLERQNGKCAICGRELVIINRETDVDHCHRTGAIRGLLCHPCNLGLGHVEKDEGKWLKSALAYIERQV